MRIMSDAKVPGAWEIIIHNSTQAVKMLAATMIAMLAAIIVVPIMLGCALLGLFCVGVGVVSVIICAVWAGLEWCCRRVRKILNKK